MIEMTPAPKDRKAQAEEAANKYIADKPFTLSGFNSAERGLIYSAYHRAYLQGWHDADSTPPQKR